MAFFDVTEFILMLMKFVFSHVVRYTQKLQIYPIISNECGQAWVKSLKQRVRVSFI